MRRWRRRVLKQKPLERAAFVFPHLAI
jgi:hypothetical protein